MKSRLLDQSIFKSGPWISQTSRLKCLKTQVKSRSLDHLWDDLSRQISQQSTLWPSIYRRSIDDNLSQKIYHVRVRLTIETSPIYRSNTDISLILSVFCRFFPQTIIDCRYHVGHYRFSIYWQYIDRYIIYF